MMVFHLTLARFACCVSHHNNRCKQSVPRSLLYMLWDLILTSYTINSLPVSCPTNKPLDVARKSQKEKQPSQKKLQSNVSQTEQSPHAKIQALFSNFSFHPNYHLPWFCTNPFHYKHMIEVSYSASTIRITCEITTNKTANAVLSRTIGLV